MSTISAVGGGNSAWSDLSASRASAMKEKMFAKVDSDGSGAVDGAELQAMLDDMAKRSGAASGSGGSTAAELLSKMDSDGNGSLGADELDSAMKSLRPAASSTVNFAQQREGGGGGGPGGPGGPPPGPPPTDSSASSSSSSSTSTDALDTNQDGTVSEQERMAGEMASALQTLAAAVDSDGDQRISQSEADTFRSTLDSVLSSMQASDRGGAQALEQGRSGQGADTSGDGQGGSARTEAAGGERLKKLVELLSQQYQLAAANASQMGQGSSLSVAA